MEKIRYVVTDQAGPKVAGRQVSAGDVIELTEPEARYELLNQTVALPPAPTATATEAPAEAPPATIKRR